MAGRRAPFLDRERDARPDKIVRLWFQDEARFGQQGTLTRVWARTGSRPAAVRQTQYDWLWVSAFVCPETGEALGAVHPDLNAGRVGQLLDAFSRHLPADEHAVLVWDNAGFHTAGMIAVPPNVTLLPLPPYSPELNPAENLWHYLRSHHWSNRSYADYAALLDAACRAWDAVSSNAESIKTICATPVITKRAN